jgi:phosphoribosylformylglycinamidine synthase
VELLVAAAARGLLASAHDVSDGGLAVALCESAFAAAEPVGFDADLASYAPGVDAAGLLFGEDQGRAVVSAAPGDVPALLALAREHGVPAAVVGAVGAPGAPVRIRSSAGVVERPVERLREVYERAIPRRMEVPAAMAAGA